MRPTNKTLTSVTPGNFTKSLRARTMQSRSGGRLTIDKQWRSGTKSRARRHTSQSSEPRKQKRTIKQLHADLIALGFEGSYGRVASFARAWKADRQREQQTIGRGAFVSLAFQPGEAFQFDWSED